MESEKFHFENRQQKEFDRLVSTGKVAVGNYNNGLLSDVQFAEEITALHRKVSTLGVEGMSCEWRLHPCELCVDPLGCDECEYEDSPDSYLSGEEGAYKGIVPLKLPGSEPGYEEVGLYNRVTTSAHIDDHLNYMDMRLHFQLADSDGIRFLGNREPVFANEEYYEAHNFLVADLDAAYEDFITSEIGEDDERRACKALFDQLIKSWQQTFEDNNPTFTPEEQRSLLLSWMDYNLDNGRYIAVFADSFLTVASGGKQIYRGDELIDGHFDGFSQQDFAVDDQDEQAKYTLCIKIKNESSDNLVRITHHLPLEDLDHYHLFFE